MPHTLTVLDSTVKRAGTFEADTFNYAAANGTGYFNLNRHWEKTLPGHFTGTSTGASLSLTKNTANFAGWVLLAFRPTI